MKKEALLNREELARLLEGLSKDVEKGEISLGQINEKIPQNLDVKYKLKSKDGYSKFKVSFKWSNEHRYDEPSALASSKPVKSFSYKEAKVELAASLFDINKALSDNKFPADKQVENLLNITDASIELSKPELKQGMEEVKKVTLQLKQAVDNDDIVTAKSAMTQLEKLRARFHKKYK